MRKLLLMIIGIVALSAIVFAPSETFAKKGQKQNQNGQAPQIGPEASSCNDNMDCTCTGGGTLDSLIDTEVWSVGGKNFPAGTVDTYVVPAQSGIIDAVAATFATPVFTEANGIPGDIPCQLLWSGALIPGIYDIIGDTGANGPDGIYEAGVDAICVNCVAILGPGFGGVIIDGVIPGDIDLGDPIDIFVELENLLTTEMTVYVSGGIYEIGGIVPVVTLAPISITLDPFDFHVGVSYDQGVPTLAGFYEARAQLCMNNPCDPLAGDPIATSATVFEVIDPANAD